MDCSQHAKHIHFKYDKTGKSLISQIYNTTTVTRKTKNDDTLFIMIRIEMILSLIQTNFSLNFRFGLLFINQRTFDESSTVYNKKNY